MNLQQQLLVLSVIFFSSFSSAYTTITSSSNKDCYKENNEEFRICYSKSVLVKDKRVLAELQPNDIKHVGGFVYIKYVDPKRRESGAVSNKRITIKFRPVNGTMFLYGKDIEGAGSVLETKTEQEVSLNFVSENGEFGMKTIFLSYQPSNNSSGKVYISAAQGDEHKIEFMTTAPNDYCRLSVVDAKGSIAFKNFPDDINTASFIYDTDQEKEIKFRYEEIKYQGDNDSLISSSPIESSFNKLLLGISPYIVDGGIPRLKGKINQFSKNERFKINGLGAVFVSPYIDLDVSELPAGKYTTRVTVTCN